jgi:hypothetical protein
MTANTSGEKNRREPLGEVKRELWVLSGNECAWEGCRQRLLDEDGAWIGKIVHIVGAEPGSARHDPAWAPDQLRDVSNLVLLCSVHHDKIDHPDSRDQYPVEFLHKMKDQHEARFRRAFLGFEEEFLNVTGGNLVTPCTTLDRFWPADDGQERAENVAAVNDIGGYLATLTLGARQILAFLISLDRPIDIYELARHNGEAEPDRTGKLMLELENRKLARIYDDSRSEDIPYEVVVISGPDPALRCWPEFWVELRDHMAGRTDAAVDDVIVGLDFSVLD